MIDSRLVDLPADMDPQCVTICKALNLLQGIETISSCCGHGDNDFMVVFVTSSLHALPAALYWFDACHSGRQGWRVEVMTDCGMSPVKFVAHGPSGSVGYDSANAIGEMIVKWLASEVG